MDKYTDRDIERIINIYLEDLSNHIDLVAPVLNNTLQEMERTVGTIENIIEHEFIGDPSLEKDWKTISLLYKAGFFYIPSLPHPVFKKLLKLDDKSKDNVSSLIVEWMNKDNCYQLVNIVNRWDLDVFKEKKIIFQEALQAHKEEKYVLSIPALTCQAEPIIKNCLSLDHKQMWKVKNDLKTSMENSKEEKKKEIYIDENKSRKMYLYLVSLDFISNIIFKFYKGGLDFNNVKNPFNRNVICHGALQIKDYNQELSTKIFLFLDTLHFCLSNFQDELLENKPE